MKRLITTIACIAVLFCFCTSFSADTIYRYGDWSLSVVSGADDYAFGIRSYDGADAVVTLPNDYGGYPIVRIDGYAFATNTNLQEVTLSGQITSIGDGAFAQCKNLSKIVIPNTVTQIGDNVFQGCDRVVIYAGENSDAISYAKEHEIPYVCMSAVTYVRGDADDDGEITVLDATAIQRALVELPNQTFNEIAADVDGDGLNIIDATSIQRYLAGFENIHHINEIVTVPDPTTPDSITLQPTTDQYELPRVLN